MILLSAIPPSGSPDPLVFGPPLPDGAADRPYVGRDHPYRLCLKHPGIEWYGPRDCWVCEAAR